MTKFFLAAIVLLSGVVAAQTNSPEYQASPAYQAYQELLKANDELVTNGTYACFRDKPDSTSFRIFTGYLMVDSLTVTVQGYKDGVSENQPLVFQGPISKMFLKELYANDIQSAFSNKAPSHETDSLSWSPDTISFQTGFGKLEGPQLRITNKFTMQRSTGRFVEDTALFFPDGTKTNHETGRCVLIGKRPTPDTEYAAQEKKK